MLRLVTSSLTNAGYILAANYFEESSDSFKSAFSPAPGYIRDKSSLPGYPTGYQEAISTLAIPWVTKSGKFQLEIFGKAFEGFSDSTYEGHLYSTSDPTINELNDPNSLADLEFHGVQVMNLLYNTFTQEILAYTTIVSAQGVQEALLNDLAKNRTSQE